MALRWACFEAEAERVGHERHSEDEENLGPDGKAAQSADELAAVENQREPEHEQGGKPREPLDRGEEPVGHRRGARPDRREHDQRQEDEQEERFRQSPGCSPPALGSARAPARASTPPCSTTASGMRAAARYMSARAFLMNRGKTGAVGARLKMSEPDGVRLRERQDLRQQEPREPGRPPSPTARVRSTSLALRSDFIVSRRFELEAHGREVRHRVENHQDPERLLAVHGQSSFELTWSARMVTPGHPPRACRPASRRCLQPRGRCRSRRTSRALRSPRSRRDRRRER